MEEDEEIHQSDLKDVLLSTVPSPQFVVKCNKLAMDYMRRGNLEYSFKLLQKAKKFLDSTNEFSPAFSEQDHNRLLSLTLNNLGCLYKKYILSLSH